MRALPAQLLAGLRAGLGPIAVSLEGHEIVSQPFLNKDTAFSMAERDAFGLRGLLPPHVATLEEQVTLELEHVRRKSDDLERYIGLAALQDRNETLFHRVLADHLDEFMPAVYTPTVGRACQEFSHIMRRPRGVWITPDDVDRVPAILRAAGHEDVRLIVATDNERILGLGDQGAGGMAIPIGKLALYSAAAGIHPAFTLPVSLDVGTDRRELLDDPLYIGFREPRLRGEAYDRVIEAFVTAVREVFPRAVLQWEDFKQHNAIRLLDRYRHVLPSFNDDIQGTGAVATAGVLAALRATGGRIGDQRIVMLGAGGAGIGIARLLRAAFVRARVPAEVVSRAIVLVDTRGLVHTGRPGLDADKREFALSGEALESFGLAAQAGAGAPVDLESVIRAVRPSILVGTSGVAGSFTEAAVRAMAAATERPVILPLSNPTGHSEALPTDILAWTDGRAIVAAGSPFPPVIRGTRTHLVSQANNVYVFPGIGLGAIVAEAREVTDKTFLLVAEHLAGLVSAPDLAAGALYPPVTSLRGVARSVARVVIRHARSARLGLALPDDAIDAAIDAAIWDPRYVEYVPA
jgi:malic enzyme